MRLLMWAGLMVVAALPLRASEQVTNFVLDNGLEVVVIEDHRAPVVVHMLWYRAGAADERPGVSGVAHFLEHLLFKGTKTMASGEFSKTVSRNGGRDNAFTNQDYTGYYQRVAADRLELMMRMEADRMVNLQLAEEDILTERDVIIEERNQRTENSPSALFREQKSAAQYLNHPYGIPVIGWRHEMEQLSLADALEYYRQYYAPNNAILVVAGDVNPNEVRVLAETYYGVHPANPKLSKRARPSEPRHLAERRVQLRDKRVAQPYVSRSYIAPERDSGDQRKAAALVLLAELLGGGQTSVLTQALQFDSKQAVYTAAWYNPTLLDDTTFTVLAVPAPGISLRDIEDAMDAQLQKFFATGVDSEHLKRIKRQVYAAQIYARDDVEALANRYGQALTAGLTVVDVQDWPTIVQSISAEEIMAAAREVLVIDGAVTGWLNGDDEVSQ